MQMAIQKSPYTLEVAPDDPIVGQPGNKQLGKSKRTVASNIMSNLNLLLADGSAVDMGFEYGETREISFVLEGQVQFQEVEVTVWTSENDSNTATITGPVKIIDLGTNTVVIGCDD